mmetsp:Transcript_122939/g.244572  ORF Transcript_122939/g.244572 Transcript_122939/m.244572 type:complete len:687 (-) Transcript_122939:168-2228(-)
MKGLLWVLKKCWTKRYTASTAEETSQWLVGGRYELLKPAFLREKPDPTSAVAGQLQACDVVLVLIMHVSSAQPPTEHTTGDPELWVYLANTRCSDWISGWGRVEDGGAPILGCHLLKPSWQLGGRYRLAACAVLRAGVELESDKLYEISVDEEVLMLELVPVFVGDQPRLRGYVRTDAGFFGWLTVELPGSPPLLEHINLLGIEAVNPNTSRWCWRKEAAAVRRSKCPRLSCTGVSEGDEVAWEIESRYRLLQNAILRADADLSSKSIGSLNRGMVVLVLDIRLVQQMFGPESNLRLLVAADDGSRGWISSTTSSGDVVVDVRDQLEYEKLMKSCGQVIDAEQEKLREAGLQQNRADDEQWGEVYEYTVQLQRSGRDFLGISMSDADGQHLVIEAVNAGGLVEAWNETNPDRCVACGDIIVSVNGRTADPISLMHDLTQQPILDLTLRSRCINKARDVISETGAPEDEREEAGEEACTVGAATDANSTKVQEQHDAATQSLEIDAALSETTQADVTRRNSLFWKQEDTAPNSCCTTPRAVSVATESCDVTSNRICKATDTGTDFVDVNSSGGSHTETRSCAGLPIDIHQAVMQSLPTRHRPPTGGGKLNTMEDGRDWKPVEAGGTTDVEESLGVCPCRPERSQHGPHFLGAGMNWEVTLFDCGTTNRRLLRPLGWKRDVGLLAPDP